MYINSESERQILSCWKAPEAKFSQGFLKSVRRQIDRVAPGLPIPLKAQLCMALAHMSSSETEAFVKHSLNIRNATRVELDMTTLGKTRVCQMDQLTSTLSAIKQLRSSVGQVFETLAGGVRAEHGDENKETKFLLEFQELFNSVNFNLREVESVVNGLTPPPAPFNLGNTSFLTQETTQERQALYPQLVNSYKWIDKIHDYSFLANNLLNCNSLRRSYISCSNKRARYPISSCNSTSPQHLDKLLNEINLNSMHTNYKICRPFGSNAVLMVNIGRVLKAAIVFKGVMIEWVTVKGYDENLDVEDLWTESRYEVFRKVQEQAHSAMLHFYSPALPDLAVKSYMTWIHSYNKLFIEPCRKCSKHLHSALPPTCRDSQTLEPFHEECRSC